MRREWFTYWFQHSLIGRAAPQPVNWLLQLAPFARHELNSELFLASLQTVAQELGPLFSPLPGMQAQEAVYLEESAETWWKAAQALRDLGQMLESLPTISRDASKTARKRRALRSGEAAFWGDWEELTSVERREVSDPFKASPGVSPRDHAEAQISSVIDAWWFPKLNLPDVPEELTLPHLRLDEAQLSLQLNMPTGMQAVLVTALQDRRLGRNLLIRECSRPTCRVIAFMSPRQRYCSDRCRNAAGMQRHAAKLKRQKEARGKKVKGGGA